MVTSIITWYIVDGHTTGVIIFNFLFIAAAFYMVMRYPKSIIVVLVTIVTQGINCQLNSLVFAKSHLVLIVGYELEEQKVGRKVNESVEGVVYVRHRLNPALPGRHQQRPALLCDLSTSTIPTSHCGRRDLCNPRLDILPVSSHRPFSIEKESRCIAVSTSKLLRDCPYERWSTNSRY